MNREMEAPADAPTASELSHIDSATSCVHSRIIDDVLTRNGKRTGKVRCCECKAIIDDPYQGLK
ncbi:MAG TPA: hypothetical protein VKP13_16335 [Nitrospira sp.]|nr:hypothetical protein [Nitrospira sp.]